MIPFLSFRSRAALAVAGLAICLAASAARGADVVGTIPPDAVMLMHLTIKEKDPGQKWVFTELTSFLIARAREKQESARLGDVNLFRFSDFCFALLPRDRDDRDRLLLAATLLPGTGQFDLTYGTQKFQLNIRDEKTAAGAQTALLSIILGIICEVRSGGAPEDGIYFNSEREKKGRFSAYYVSDTRAFLATGRQLIAGALVEKHGIASTPPFTAVMGLLPDGWDAYGYANDEGAGLSRYLREKEKGWATLVLALLDPARKMGLALDIEDKDRCRAVAVFPLSTAAEVHALRARLEAALTMLLAECLDPRIKAELQYEELPRALRISARLSDTGPFWEKAFGGKEKKKSAGERRATGEAAELPASTGAVKL
jgi:hypothetical protein